MLTHHRRRVTRTAGILGAWLLGLAPFLPVALPVFAGPPADLSADWLSRVEADIAAREYQVTWQDHTPLGDHAGAYQAPNRAQNFRTYFTPSGIRSIPRDTPRDLAPAWEWGLEFRTLGRAGAMRPVEEAILGVNAHRVEYRRGELVEWYLNDSRGLEQGFTIPGAPDDADPPSPLRLEFTVSGNLAGIVAGACDAVDFTAPAGARAIRLADLRAADATGTGLRSWFEVEGPSLFIVVDDSGATYPITIDPLATSPNWTAEGDQERPYFGYSVASAGDVNGDGYGDVIVGAARYDNGQADEGRAYVYHGSAAGLATTAGWTAESDQADALFGYSVATAGDVNGDGYSDVIVGADKYDHGQLNEGQAFVYHGSAGGLSATADWTAESDKAGAYFGNSVAAAGDVNGDGYGDVIVGALYCSNGQTEEGMAWVYHGSAAGLATTAGWTAESDQAYARFGVSVAAAGDVNADGYGDVVIGSYTYASGESNEGRAFVYHGSAAGLSLAAAWTGESDQVDALFGICVATAGDVNGDGCSDVIIGSDWYDHGEIDEGRVFVYHGSPEGLPSTANWTAEGDQGYAFFGISVATAGDVNGDGYGDVIVGANNYSGGEPGEGRVFVYLGSAAGLATTAGWTAESGQVNAFFGVSVATAGDVNGDGYSDVIVGAHGYDGDYIDEGRAFVYHGSAGGLSPTAVWATESDQVSAYLGYSVATAGDVNGDGYSDVIVGAYRYDHGQMDEGRAFVYHGSAGGLSPTAGWTAESDQANAYFGCSVATAGDVNSDGYSDVVVGAYGGYRGEVGEGRAYVYCGSAGGLSPTAVWTAESDQVNARFGYSVATAGDVNGDGHSDVIVGADRYDRGQFNEGRAWVYHGSAEGLSSAASWTAEGDQEWACFGTSVATAGDVNGDGYSDVIVGAPNGVTGYGQAFAYHGSANGLSPIADWTEESVPDAGSFGISVATAGDVNGDGYSDVIVGDWMYSHDQYIEGAAFAYHGSAGGLSLTADWKAESGQVQALFGYSVATAGDVNGDGYSDVIVGAYEYDDDQTDEGRAFVHHGSAAGLSPTADWTAEGDQTDANFGISVATAGDVNGDGFSDVIVGAQGYDSGQVEEGRAFVYCGHAGGGRASLPRQLRTDGVTPIALLCSSHSGTQFRIGATLYSAYGRTRLTMEHEVKPLGVPFDGTDTVIEDLMDTGSDGRIDFNRMVPDLSPGTLYHWRVRARYDLVRMPFQRNGPWLHVPLQGWNEAQLRIGYTLSGVRAPMVGHGFALQAAGPNPARGTCSVRLALARAGRVHADVLDVGGRRLASLVDDELYGEGSHVFTWDGRTLAGGPAPAGVYFFKVCVDGEARVLKSILAR